MACSSCGKSFATRVGNSLNTAIVFGEPTNDVVRVRFMADVPGIQAGAIKYVRGTVVQSLVEDGTLALLAGGSHTLPSANGYVLYYVGSVGYTTMEAARVRSGQTGEEIVVRTFGQ